MNKKAHKMPATLRKMQANRRRLDRLNVTTQATLAAMRAGESLLLTFEWYGPSWCLSGGRRVPREVADVVTKNSNVAPLGDTPIPGERSQTWAWVKT
jgi:hypothetical protein